MKVRFKHDNMKVLVTRITGKFHIYSETKKEWDEKLTKGNFKIDNKFLYDKILEKITEIKRVRCYTYYKESSDDEWDFCDMQHIYGDLIFTVENGIITGIEVDDPKSEIIYYEMLDYQFIDFSSDSFNPKDRRDLSELPKNVIDKMKEIDDLYFKE